MVVKIDTPLTIKPARGWMVLEQIVQNTTKAGLVIPESAAKDFEGFVPQRFRVLAVGADKWRQDGQGTLPTQVKVGDIIIPAGPGACLNFDGRELWLMDVDMVMCKEVPGAQQEPQAG